MTWAQQAWQNAIWPLLLKMEAMTMDEKEEGIATAAIDSEKYFDSIRWEVTFQMVERMELDQQIWKPMLNIIAHLKRFNKGCGCAGTHVDLHQQQHAGMLPESDGNSGTVNGLGKSSGGRSTHGHLQQHCGRSETLSDRKRSAETIEVSHPGHERL